MTIAFEACRSARLLYCAVSMDESARHQLWYGGMAGASFVAVTQMLGQSDLNTAHRIALACFAIVLPISVSFAVWPAKYSVAKLSEKMRKRIQRAGLLATIIFASGVIVLFTSFGAIFGIILFVGAVLTAALGNAAIDSLKKKDD
jgi:flagellar biosynthesis protein FliP